MKLTGLQQDRAAGLLTSLALATASPGSRWGASTALALSLLSSTHPGPAEPPDAAERMDLPDVVGGVAAAVALSALQDPPRRTAERARGLVTALTGDDAAAADSARWAVLLRSAVLTGEVPATLDAGAPEHRGWAAGSTVVLGATRGWSAIPFADRRHLTGPSGGNAEELMRRAVAAALGTGGGASQAWPVGPTVDYSSWVGRTARAVHPSDPGVVLGGVGALGTESPDAVVSLCRLGTADRPASVAARDHAAFWLVDTADPAENPHLRLVLEDAARTVQLFRAEGKRVLLHCVQAQSRTPTVAALYGSLVTGEPAWAELLKIVQVLPDARVNRAFEQELRKSVAPAV